MLYHVKISIFNNISNNVIFANYAKSALLYTISTSAVVIQSISV